MLEEEEIKRVWLKKVLCNQITYWKLFQLYVFGNDKINKRRVGTHSVEFCHVSLRSFGWSSRQLMMKQPPSTPSRPVGSLCLFPSLTKCAQNLKQKQKKAKSPVGTCQTKRTVELAGGHRGRRHTHVNKHCPRIVFLPPRLQRRLRSKIQTWNRGFHIQEVSHHIEVLLYFRSIWNNSSNTTRDVFVYFREI